MASGKAVVNCAIKQVLVSKSQNKTEQAALFKENEIASKMHFPFVAKAYGFTEMADGFMI